MRGGSLNATQPRICASTETISYFCATDRSSIVSSGVEGRTGSTGKMKVRRVERIALLSDSCTTGRCVSASVESAGCGGLEIACICSLRTGELLIIYSFSTRNSWESQERRVISASELLKNVLEGSSSGMNKGGGVG